MLDPVPLVQDGDGVLDILDSHLVDFHPPMVLLALNVDHFSGLLHVARELSDSQTETRVTLREP